MPSCNKTGPNSTQAPNINITVLAGGPGRERAVSLASGRETADALETAGYNVTLADVSGNDLSALDLPTDVFFIALHGTFGEDGKLQRILDERNLLYCGSGPEGCSLSIDKNKSKLIFRANDIPTPAFATVFSVDQMRFARACWSMPVVVKPVCEGSSIGTTIVERAGALDETIEQTLSDFGPVLVEEFIGGKELTVGILADRALPVIEIRPDGQFYDYDAKYHSSATQYLFDIDIEPELYARIQELALRAASVLGMRDFCRVDVLLDDQDRPYVFEVNAIPGFTSHSLLPKAARRTGLEMPALCSKIVEMALKRSEKINGEQAQEEKQQEQEKTPELGRALL